MMPAPVAFLPRPREAQKCACGELLTMEMERDSGRCVECMRGRRALVGVPA